jgi:putative aminopeptidase FrvX
MIAANVERIVHTLTQLTNIASPTGYTEDVIDWVEKYVKDMPITTKRSRKGGLLITLSGERDDRHRMLTAHVDTLGAMVKEIKSSGRLKLTMIGGFAWNSIEGEYCLIHTLSGKTYSGTIVLTKSSVHVHGDETRDAKRTQDVMEVRIDAKVTSREETEALGIRIGDFVSFAPRVEVTESGFVKSRHLDDKASVAILLEAIRHMTEQGIRLPYTTHFLISNNEEIGYGGNSNITPETVEYVAVDMGAIGDGQATDEYTVSICAKDSSGPYHYGLRKKFVELAEENGIPYQLDIYPYYGSDASAAMRAGHDVVHGLIGPGIDASHSFERTHKDSLDATFRLIVAYLQSGMVEG